MGKGRQFNSYREISGKWKSMMTLAQGIGITFVVAFLFYKSIAGLLAGILIIPFWLRLKKEEKRVQYQAQMESEYKEYMMLIVASLQTGYSLERALNQAEAELKKLYPQGSILLASVHIMNQKITMNVQVEKAFDEFAKTTGLEEAASLSEIISFAKRCGGDYGRHIRETAMKIEDNISVKQEIETITTEKRLELKVMCVMPMLILAYISLTSASFIAPLYGNIVGVGLMSGCLILYGILIVIGRKIIDIKV
ncbi:tight adherence protein B [Pseudobutyrivibrio sp. 49]|uniref:type II secretion system F family protein n=2 Tax=unclassified Pseudobutyrivibrio TaxID=2638619 RepID=UPI0008921632|nr:hypothetical protein [Pseudobutyrivibrio sp. UC1225]SDH72346.1 tight adherence protein B [Pseudobutyrivibrio sp. 49]SFN74869.1 tight adherence protein B [Pseudobutyrivibrio sp. UC1225]